jgi:hypothetical protein
MFTPLHCKKRLAVFPSPAGMSLIKLSQGGNNLIIPSQGELGKLHPGWGRENRKSFITVYYPRPPGPCVVQFLHVLIFM